MNAIPAANPVTGIGRYVLELYSALRGIAGPDVEIRYFDGNRLADEPPHGPQDLARFSRLGRIYWKLPLALALPIRLAHHHRREVLFRRLSEGAHIYHETAFFPFRPAGGVRIVQTVHDLSLQFHPEWHPAERAAYASRYFAPRLAWASRILCVSDFTRRELLRFDPSVEGKVAVTPLGVQPRFHPASADDVRRVRERYGLPQHFFLFVGSGDPRKNTRLLARVMARRSVPWPLVCAGWDGWVRPAQGGDAMMLGYVPDDDLPALYTAAGAFVFPSLYEGFGLPVLEAMACGCPVVVPRAHSMPELVGDCGLYVSDPTSVEELEAALIRVANDGPLRVRLSAAGLQQARRFDWAETARATLAEFERAL